MPEVSLRQLTRPELQNLRRVSRGGAVSDVMYLRLTGLGLIRKDFRGWVLTAGGQAHLAAQDEDEI